MMCLRLEVKYLNIKKKKSIPGYYKKSKNTYNFPDCDLYRGCWPQGPTMWWAWVELSQANFGGRRLLPYIWAGKEEQQYLSSGGPAVLPGGAGQKDRRPYS